MATVLALLIPSAKVLEKMMALFDKILMVVLRVPKPVMVWVLAILSGSALEIGKVQPGTTPPVTWMVPVNGTAQGLRASTYLGQETATVH